MAERYSTSRVAQILDVSVATLNRWYKWYESDDYEKPVGLKLPQYVKDSRGTELFTMKDIQKLAAFKDSLQGEYRGCMAEFNAVYQWGQRGTEILNLGKQYKKKKEDENAKTNE